GKTYVGTLLDCTKHDWAPPRFCESPTSDFFESKSLSKSCRRKRGRSSFGSEGGCGSGLLGGGLGLGLDSWTTLSSVSKLRNGKGRRTANPSVRLRVKAL